MADVNTQRPTPEPVHPRQARWKRWVAYSESKTLRRAVAVTVLILIILSVESLVSKKGEPLSFDPSRVAYAVVELIAIIDPVGALPTFLLFVGGVDDADRKKVVETMTAVVVSLLLFFTLLGQPLLSLLGVSVTSFELGGGIILLVLAVDMLQGRTQTKSIDLQEVAVVPLATPLLVGPGTLTALIVLSNQMSALDVLVGSAVSALIVYLVFYFSRYIFRMLGQNGVKAVSRLFTIVLAAIAAQMIHNALLGWGIARF